MKLESDYFSSMDRKKDNYITSISNIGVSTHAGKDQLQELKGKIFKGAGAVELGFMGRSKGVKGRGNTTPGMHGKEERKAMKDLAKVNKVKLSTHATVGAGSWSGFQKNKFDEKSREENIFEGKRAVDFAADVTDGGPVVVHTGEFPRDISEAPQPKGGKFTNLAEQEKQKVHYLMDKKTGNLVDGIREDQENFLPVTLKEGEEAKSIWDKSKIKHLKWKDNKPGFKLDIKARDWAHYKKKAERNKKKWDEKYRDPASNNYDPKKSSDPAVLFHYDKLEAAKNQSQGQADEYEMSYRKMREEWEKAHRALEFWKKKWSKLSPIEKRRNMEVTGSVNPDEPYVRNKIEHFKRQLQNIEKQMSYGKETATHARSQIAEIEDKQKRVVPLKNFAVDKSADSIAQLAIFANDEQKKKNLKKDLFIAPENIFPEMGYGSHPEELRNIVEKSRKKMVEKLTDPKSQTYQPGLSKNRAEELAERHIKATFDIGHANTWKKFFKGKPGEFKKWLTSQVKKLGKDGVLGHVHITDNFGYYDEHLSPGQGNVPVKDFVKELRKSGYKGQITVETAEQDYKAVTEMWRMANSPVYKIDGASRSWTDVQHGYFGRTSSPNYLFGKSSPNPEVWKLWSGVPLE